MSIAVMSMVWKQGPIDRSQRLLLLAIADSANDQGICWPSTQTLADKACMSVRSALRALKALEEDGWLKIQRKAYAHKGNSYWVDLERLGDNVSRDRVSHDELSRDKTGKSQVTNQAKSGDKTCNPLQPPLGRTVKNRKEPAASDAQRAGFELPPWIPVEPWNDFEQMRHSIKKPMTAAAKKLLVGKLSDLQQNGHDPTAVLQQSVMNSWQSVFPVRDDNARGRPSTSAAAQIKTLSEKELRAI